MHGARLPIIRSAPVQRGARFVVFEVLVSAPRFGPREVSEMLSNQSV